MAKHAAPARPSGVNAADLQWDPAEFVTVDENTEWLLLSPLAPVGRSLGWLAMAAAAFGGIWFMTGQLDYAGVPFVGWCALVVLIVVMFWTGVTLRTQYTIQARGVVVRQGRRQVVVQPGSRARFRLSTPWFGSWLGVVTARCVTVSGDVVRLRYVDVAAGQELRDVLCTPPIAPRLIPVMSVAQYDQTYRNEQGVESELVVPAAPLAQPGDALVAAHNEPAVSVSVREPEHSTSSVGAADVIDLCAAEAQQQMSRDLPETAPNTRREVTLEPPASVVCSAAHANDSATEHTVPHQQHTPAVEHGAVDPAPDTKGFSAWPSAETSTEPPVIGEVLPDELHIGGDDDAGQNWRDHTWDQRETTDVDAHAVQPALLHLRAMLETFPTGTGYERDPYCATLLVAGHRAGIQIPETTHTDRAVAAVQRYYFDEAIMRTSGQGIKTFVSVAAGLDTAMFRLALACSATFYDIESPSVLSFKKMALTEAGAMASCSWTPMESATPATTAAEFSKELTHLPVTWLLPQTGPTVNPTGILKLIGQVWAQCAPGSHICAQSHAPLSELEPQLQELVADGGSVRIDTYDHLNSSVEMQVPAGTPGGFVRLAKPKTR